MTHNTLLVIPAGTQVAFKGSEVDPTWGALTFANFQLTGPSDTINASIPITGGEVDRNYYFSYVEDSSLYVLNEDESEVLSAHGAVVEWSGDFTDDTAILGSVNHYGYGVWLHIRENVALEPDSEGNWHEVV